MESNYLELLKKMLIDYDQIGKEEYHPLTQVDRQPRNALLFLLDKWLRSRNYTICKTKKVLADQRLNGLDWPARAKTMIGYHRLTHLEQCVHRIRVDKIAGDVLEAGVWRGGASMYLKALLKVNGLTHKTLWMADSFQGLPRPTKDYPHDHKVRLHRHPILKATREEVEANFKAYGLWDDGIRIIEGWFEDTLPKNTVEKLSLLRLDADLYESTHLGLQHLYPKLQAGGFVIIDDYHAFQFCKQAVDDYRTTHAIQEPLIKIDTEAVFWRKRA